MRLIFIDCEAVGGCPRTGQLTEFGAVDYKTLKTYHGVLVDSRPSQANPAIPEIIGVVDEVRCRAAFIGFNAWLASFEDSRLVMVSDNPAFDWQWINDGFWRYLGRNPLGFSARRIGDFYAGLTGDFYNANKWKHLRLTKHDHNPVNDAMGNAEAFDRMVKGER